LAARYRNHNFKLSTTVTNLLFSLSYHAPLFIMKTTTGTTIILLSLLFSNVLGTLPRRASKRKSSATVSYVHAVTTMPSDLPSDTPSSIPSTVPTSGKGKGNMNKKKGGKKSSAPTSSSAPSTSTAPSSEPTNSFAPSASVMPSEQPSLLPSSVPTCTGTGKGKGGGSKKSSSRHRGLSFQDADAETAGKAGKGGKGGKGGSCYEDEDKEEESGIDSGIFLLVKVSALETSSSKRLVLGLASVAGLVIGLTTM
jgi:hypothetical protein